jgi:hypothetical protein
VQSNQGKAEYQRAVQQAAQIRTLAQAEAEKVARVGIAQAIATEEQVRAYGGPQFQVTQQVLNRFAEAIQQARVDVVPRVLIGNDQQGGGNLMQGLLAMLLSERLGENIVTGPRSAERSPEVEALRAQVRQSMQSNPADTPPSQPPAKPA